MIKQVLPKQCTGGVQTISLSLRCAGSTGLTAMQQEGIFVPAPPTEAMQTRSSRCRKAPSCTAMFQSRSTPRAPKHHCRAVPRNAARLHHSLCRQSSPISKLLPSITASPVQGIGRSSRSSCQNCGKAPHSGFPALLPLRHALQ